MTETTTKIINPATSEAISVYGLPYFAQEKKYYRFSEKDMDTVAGVNPFLATWPNIRRAECLLFTAIRLRLNSMPNCPESSTWRI